MTKMFRVPFDRNRYSVPSRLDAISLPEPDLSVYDRLSPTPMTRDPGEFPSTTEEPS